MPEQTDHDQLESLIDIPDRLQTLKQAIPLEIQRAYLAYHPLVDVETISAADTPTVTRRLLDPTASTATKKNDLFTLAHLGTVAACQVIDRFLTTTTDQELNDWATLALEECWLLVESELLDEPRGLIMTALGGEGDRLRYFYAVEITAAQRPLSTAEQRRIKQAVTQGCREHNSILEEIDFREDYATLQILIPYDVAVADVIEQGIAASNQTGQVLEPHYFVTNVEIPIPEMIRSYLQAAKDG